MSITLGYVQLPRIAKKNWELWKSEHPWAVGYPIDYGTGVLTGAQLYHNVIVFNLYFTSCDNHNFSKHVV